MQLPPSSPPARVLMSDHAWPDTRIERDILHDAGFELHVMGAAPPSAVRVEDRVRELTPHVAFSSDASVAELRRRACEEVVRVLRGQPPLHPCNTPHNSKPAP